MRIAYSALLVLAATLTACGGGGTTAPTSTGNNGNNGNPPGTPAPVSTNTVNATAENAFSPNSIQVGVGTTVSFVFASVVHNVNFSGTGAPANIPNSSSTTVTRTFATAGVYTYDCNLHAGMTGKVTVQ
ncbi:MAG: cupredoxin domain-containing protein [Gemmatimonadaceae bacterium]